MEVIRTDAVLPAAAQQERERHDTQPRAPGVPAASAPPAARLPGDLAPLWSVADLARYLQKSRRWVFQSLRLPDGEPGSVPHVKLGRSPRFIPDDMRAWASMGFPPAATFRQWQEVEKKAEKKRFRT